MSDTFQRYLSQKPEARSQKPEARSQKPEARSQKNFGRGLSFVKPPAGYSSFFHQNLTFIPKNSIFSGSGNIPAGSKNIPVVIAGTSFYIDIRSTL
jgi:hypothetical protein